MNVTKIVVEKNVPCTLRDGTVLRADVYRPDSDDKYPVLLTRHPYNKENTLYAHRYMDPIKTAGKGYAVIIQDVRGRYASEGTFEFPYAAEAEDGFDSVEWAAALPYSNGNVGMYGMSYFGYTQWLAATQRPPHLKAIFPAITFNDLRKGVNFYGGAYMLALNESWSVASISADLLLRKHGVTQELYASLRDWTEHFNKLDDNFWVTPVNQYPPLKQLDVSDFFFEHMENPLEDPFWERFGITDKFEQIEVPVYHLGGWYDCFIGPTLENYTSMIAKGGTELARKNQKLIIGPWAHNVFLPVIGERNFGLHSSGEWINMEGDVTALHLRWFDYWLKGIDTKIMEEPPVKIFVMGINQWRSENEWPLARTNYVNYYLHSAGHANSRNGDGLLSTNRPSQEQQSDEFIYDPQKPVMTRGGATLFAGVLTMGPRDQGVIEDRQDVLVYSTPPLSKPLEVTGPVKVILWASTDAADTDFTAKLVDVMPDGTPFNLADGIVRAKYRNGFKPNPIEPGEIVQYEIDLWATSNVFLAGHRIRIEISSSNFPRFDRNPNTGGTTLTSSEMQIARQQVYHNAMYPSHVILPVIPS